MDYVDWVDRVIGSVTTAWRVADTETQHFVGVSFADIANALGFDSQAAGFESTKEAEGLNDALRDLQDMGLLKAGVGHHTHKLTQEGRKEVPQGDPFLRLGSNFQDFHR